MFIAMIRTVLLLFVAHTCNARYSPQLTMRSAHLERPEKLADPVYPSATVFAPKMQNITCFRIPSVVQLPDGTLLAFAEARRGSCGDGDSHEIASRSSKDGGLSWSNLKIAAGNETYWVGNPEVVVRSDGTLLMLVALHGKGCTGNCVTGNALLTSADGGITWAEPRDITAAMGPATKARTGPGTALLLKSGPAKGRTAVH
jgi:sialidase-1